MFLFVNYELLDIRDENMQNLTYWDNQLGKNSQVTSIEPNAVLHAATRYLMRFDMDEHCIMFFK